MHKASWSWPKADFKLLGCPLPIVKQTCYLSVPVRTGGKEPRQPGAWLGFLAAGKKVAVIRHPMPYGTWNRFGKFATYEDLDKHKCTIERENYEPHQSGIVVYAGVDYAEIIAGERKPTSSLGRRQQRRTVLSHRLPVCS